MSTRAVAPGEAGAWFTSTYSNESNGCVQVRFNGTEVQIADTKQRGTGPIIQVSAGGWDAFVATVLGDPRPSSDAPVVTGAPDDGRTVTAADGTTLSFTAREWAAFTAGAADGEFARPAG